MPPPQPERRGRLESAAAPCLPCRRHGALSAFFRGTFAGRQLSTDIDLGRVDDDGVLSKLNAWERRRTDYTVQEVRTATERAYELECEARQLRRSVADICNH